MVSMLCFRVIVSSDLCGAKSFVPVYCVIGGGLRKFDAEMAKCVRLAKHDVGSIGILNVDILQGSNSWSL